MSYGLAFLFAVLASSIGADPAVVDPPSVELPQIETFEGHPVRTVLPPDAIRALTQPSFVPAQEADFMTSYERVLGVRIDGVARAYPLALLDWHEVVNDRLGGRPITATW